MKLFTLSLLFAALSFGQMVYSRAAYDKLSADRKAEVAERYVGIAETGSMGASLGTNPSRMKRGYKEVGCQHEEWLQDIASTDLGKRICAAVQARNPAVAKLHGAARVSAAMADRALNDPDLRVAALAIGFFTKYQPELLFDTAAFKKWWAANK